MFTKIFIVLVLVGFGVIGFGIYTYLNDQNDESTSTQNKINTTPDNQEENDDLNEEEIENDNPTEEEQDNNAMNTAVINSINQLSEEIEKDVKTNQKTQALTQEQKDYLESFNISFINYDEKKGVISIGLMLQLKTAKSCTLKISSETKVFSETVPAIISQNIAGCRFNNLDIAFLGEPSQDNPLTVVLTTTNKQQETIAIINKTVSSSEQLNNLHN